MSGCFKCSSQERFYKIWTKSKFRNCTSKTTSKNVDLGYNFTNYKVYQNLICIIILDNILISQMSHVWANRCFIVCFTLYIYKELGYMLHFKYWRQPCRELPYVVGNPYVANSCYLTPHFSFVTPNVKMSDLEEWFIMTFTKWHF